MGITGYSQKLESGIIVDVHNVEINPTMDYSGWHWQNKDPEINPKPISIQDFSKVTVSTLLMQGKLSGEFYSYTLGNLNQYIPNSKYVKISNSGHMLNLENHEQFNHEVLIFLEENNIK